MYEKIPLCQQLGVPTDQLMEKIAESKNLWKALREERYVPLFSAKKCQKILVKSPWPAFLLFSANSC